MNAFHSIWTKPSFLKDRYTMEDYNILSMIISALNWRKYNGDIKLIADEYAISYLDKIGLLHIWNDGVEELKVDDNINPNTFWAGGKIFALRNLKETSVMIDTDLIVWKNLDADLFRSDIVVMHREELLNNSVYPNKSFFKCNANYQFDVNWDWSVLPCNTALLYIEDKNFKEYYTKKSIEFMEYCLEDKNDLCSMVFAEQRLLSMCAKEKNKIITTLLDFNALNNQNDFTHIWGYKQILKTNKVERYSFCKKCIKRIFTDFPQEKNTINNIQDLRKYL